MATSMTARQILVGARAFLMDPTNWLQGGMHSLGRSCAVGALDRARFGGSTGRELLSQRYEAEQAGETEQLKLALNYLRRAIGCDPDDAYSLIFTDVPYWNDAEGRTHEEIIAGFDTAILQAARDEMDAYLATAVRLTGGPSDEDTLQAALLPEGTPWAPIPDFEETRGGVLVGA